MVMSYNFSALIRKLSSCFATQKVHYATEFIKNMTKEEAKIRHLNRVKTAPTYVAFPKEDISSLVNKYSNCTVNREVYQFIKQTQ